MGLVILEMVLIVQCLFYGVRGEVNNIVKSKILFSNQDLVEKNTLTLHKSDKMILTKAEILEFLEQHVALDDLPKMREFFDTMSSSDLKHIDHLIFLMGHYRTAAPHLLQSIFEILREDDTRLNDLMGNFFHSRMPLIWICYGYGETTQIIELGFKSVCSVDGSFKFKPCLLEHSQIQKCDFIRIKKTGDENMENNWKVRLTHCTNRDYSCSDHSNDV